MGLIGTLDILSRVDTSGLKKGAAEASGIVKKLSDGIGGVGGSLAALGGGLSVAGAVLGLKSLGESSVDLITSTTKTAAKLGTTTKELSELRYAAKYTGTDVEALENSMAKLSVHLGTADEEGGKTADSLKRIGLDAKVLANENPAEQMRQLVGGFGKLPDQADKAAVAMALFGKGGVGIIPFLTQGTAKLNELTQESRDLGISIDDLSAKSVVEAAHSFEKIKDSIQAVSNEVVIGASPAVKEFTTSILNMTKAAGGASKIKDVLGQIFQAATGDVVGLFSGGVPDAQKIGGAPKPDAKALADARAADAAAVLAEKVSGLNRDLKKEAETFGFSAGQVKLWELANEGATSAQLEQATALVAQRKTAEEAKKAQDELTASAKHFTESSRNPFAQYTEDLRKLDELLKSGKITQDAYASAVDKAKTTYESTGRSLVDGLATPYEKVVLKITDLQKQLKEGTISQELFDRASKASWKDLKDAGKALAAPSLTPIEQYVKRRKELLKGLEEGTIDQRQFNRGIKEAHTNALEKGGSEPKFASVAGDSAEARSLALKATFGTEGKDPFGDLKKTGNEQTKLQGSMVSVLQSIDKKLGNSSDLPEQDF